MRGLAPHLRQALRLHRRLAPALALGATLNQLVRRIDLPLLFLAADGRIVDRNPAADKALVDTQGWLRHRDGQLCMRTTAAWEPVQRLLEGLPCAGSLSADLTSEDLRCATLEARLVHGAATDRSIEYPVFAVCTLTPGARDRGHALRSLYGLTPREARIAMQIAAGLSPADIAAAARLSIATVRTHIAVARQKLGVSRQAQLAARVLAL